MNLIGEADNELVLHGEALTQGEGGAKSTDSLLRYLTSDLYLFFGQYKMAAESALDRGEESNEFMAGNAMVMPETFHRGVSHCLNTAFLTRP